MKLPLFGNAFNSSIITVYKQVAFPNVHKLPAMLHFRY